MSQCFSHANSAAVLSTTTMITSFFAPKAKSTSSQSSPVLQIIDTNEKSTREREGNSDENSAGKKARLGEVEELLLQLTDGDDEINLWRSALAQYTASSAFMRLAQFVALQRNQFTIYPPPQDTFTALNWTKLDQVKVVIVGQDPYHGPQQAHGLSFSVRKGVDIPPSLKNIYKELSNDTSIDFPRQRVMPRHGYLERWARQGVLLLNTVLTVRKGDANSHKQKGWEGFTDEVIRVVAKQHANRGLVFLLWGRPASKKATEILDKMQRKNIVVIATSHPSPLGAAKTPTPFLGSKCFSRTNEALTKMGLEPIDWNVDD